MKKSYRYEDFWVAWICLLMFCFVGSVPASAQCNWSFTRGDATCDDSEMNVSCNAVSIGNCVSGTFSAPCTGTYTLAAFVACAGAGCEYCISCVKLYEVTSGGLELLVATLDSRGSANGACDNTTNCQQTTSVSLTSNLRYKLYVCKTSCPTSLDIGCGERCSATCTAKGCLGIGTGICP